MKKILLLIVSIVFFSLSQAQVSGYMGKKFSITYSPGISFPHLRGIYDENKMAVLPSFNHALSLDYAFTMTNSIGIKYKLSRNSALNLSNYNSINKFEKRHKFFGHTMGIYLKMFSRKMVAPLGLYTKAGLNFQYLILKDRVTKEYNYSARIKDYYQFDVLATFSVGKNWLLFDNLLLGFEFEGGFPFASLIRTVGSLGEANEDFSKNGSPITSRINASTEILKVSLNIGLLAF